MDARRRTRGRSETGIARRLSKRPLPKIMATSRVPGRGPANFRRRRAARSLHPPVFFY